MVTGSSTYSPYMYIYIMRDRVVSSQQIEYSPPSASLVQASTLNSPTCHRYSRRTPEARRNHGKPVSNLDTRTIYAVDDSGRSCRSGYSSSVCMDLTCVYISGYYNGIAVPRYRTQPPPVVQTKRGTVGRIPIVWCSK